MKNGSRKRTHRFGLIRLGLVAISLAALLPVGVSFAQTVSYTRTDFAVGIEPHSVAIGDLNGDGIPDLATANVHNGTVSVLLGTGDGTFGPATHLAVGSFPIKVAIGDLNGDGKPDLAVANALDHTVSILLGTGTGSFGTATNFPVQGQAVSVAIGDFNGDGRPDLAVVNVHNGTVSVLLGNGNGTFGAATNFDVGSFAIEVAIGDLNGDGNLDLAVTNGSSNTVSILLGTGTGAFGPATNLSLGDSPYSVAIGDLNGDGKPDLAVTIALSNNVSILLGNGDGTFGAATNFDVGTEPRSVAIGDLNGDGKPDLAVVNAVSDTVSILLNTTVDTTVDTTPPVLTLPSSGVVEATGPNGAVVTFSASAFDTMEGALPVTLNPPSGSTFPLGTTTVNAHATDAAGNTATGSFTVTVRDTTAPVITSLVASPAILWPPNHKMVAITITGEAIEAVSAVTGRILSVTSNEPDNGLGDGDTANDIVITGPNTVNLRAERSGKGNGRIYTITFAASDTAGNTSTKTVTVLVPKSQGT